MNRGVNNGLIIIALSLWAAFLDVPLWLCCIGGGLLAGCAAHDEFVEQQEIEEE